MENTSEKKLCLQGLWMCMVMENTGRNRAEVVTAGVVGMHGGSGCGMHVWAAGLRVGGGAPPLTGHMLIIYIYIYNMILCTHTSAAAKVESVLLIWVFHDAHIYTIYNMIVYTHTSATAMVESVLLMWVRHDAWLHH